MEEHGIEFETARDAADGETAPAFDPEFDWDAFKFLMQLSISGSFDAAGAALERDPRTISKKITELENTFPEPLLYRTGKRVRLTDYGRDVVDEVRPMLEAEAKIKRMVRLRGATGRVSVRLTEGLGTYWIQPHLQMAFGEDHGLLLDLQPQMAPSNVSELETDIAVQFVEPTNASVVKKKLGVLHMGVFASRSYLEQHGTPNSIDELENHHIAFQSSDQIDEKFLIAMLGERVAKRALRVKTQSSVGLFQAIRMNNMGVMPTYTHLLGLKLVPVPIITNFKETIWLAYNPEAAKRPAVRLVIDEIIQCFDKKKFPWFGEKYMAPEELEKIDPTPWRHCIAWVDPNSF